MRIVLVAALLGFLINLGIGLLVFRSLMLGLGFAVFGLVLGGSFGLMDLFLRRRGPTKRWP